MTLLDPASALIAGALSVPILLVLYFLKLRRRRLRVGSTLLWHRAVQDLQVNEPFRWLKPSALLFMQLLALLLMVTALGRPTIPGGSSAGDKVTLIIDRSASMNAIDGASGGSRFDEAVLVARDIIDSMSRGASVQIISYAANAEILLAHTTDHKAAQRALTRLTPTDQPGKLEHALQLVQNIESQSNTEQPADSNGPLASIILITDGSQDGTNLTLARGKLEFRRVGPPADTSYDNLGITHISVTNDFNDPSLTRVFLRVQNALDREVAVTVNLTGNRGIFNSQALRVPAAVPGQLGNETLSFELDRGYAGLITASFERNDLLRADNTAHAIIAPAHRPSLLLVTPDNDDSSLDWVLRDILEEIDSDQFRQIRNSQFLQLLADEDLIAVDLVILDRVDVPLGIPAPSISFSGTLPGLIVRKDADRSDRFTIWERSHPILGGLVLDSIRISEPAWFVHESESHPFDELASGRFGPVIVMQSQGEYRRLGIAFEPAQSNWPLDIAFPLFLIQAIEYFTFEAGQSSNAATDTATNASIQISGGVGTIELTGPASLSTRVSPTQRDQSTTAYLGIPERSGVYRDDNGNAVLAVNLSSAIESAVATADSVSIAGRSISSGYSESGTREIWQWFVIGSLLVLTLEWLFFARRMRA